MSMSMNIVVRMSLVAALAAGTFLGSGCGDDDGGSASGGDGGPQTGHEAGSGGGGSGAPSTLEPGDEISAEISAAEGGEVTLGAVTLAIPAGALADDTTITVEVLDKADQPGAADIVADVFDFGPDGTEFSKPVTLEFDVGDLEVPSGKDAVIAFLDGSEWTTLEDSELSGGTITATTTHFTPFTVRLVLRPDGGVGQVGGQCAPDDFDACGGDLVGTWEYTGACITLPPDALSGGSNDQNPFAMCTEQPQLSATVDLTGTTTFDADGTYSLEQNVNITSELLVPASCVDMLTGGQLDTAMACDQILMGTIDADGNCVGPAGDPTMEMNTGAGTWSAAGGVLTIEDAPSGDAGVDAGAPSPPEDVRYCVTGDTVVVVVKDAEQGFTMQYTATRK